MFKVNERVHIRKRAMFAVQLACPPRFSIPSNAKWELQDTYGIITTVYPKGYSYEGVKLTGDRCYYCVKSDGADRDYIWPELSLEKVVQHEKKQRKISSKSTH